MAKREKGYGGYIFDNDRYGYDRGNQNLSLVKIFKHCLDEKTIKKLLVADSYYIKELNRHLLSRFITLEKNDISLCLPREKFLRLRKYCLNPNNIVDYSAILKHPRSKEPFK